MKYVRTENGLEKLTDAEYAERFPIPEKTYKEKRIEEYGTVPEQLEYIVENGIDDFISRQKAIKVKNPKPTE